MNSSHFAASLKRKEFSNRRVKYVDQYGNRYTLPKKDDPLFKYYTKYKRVPNEAFYDMTQEDDVFGQKNQSMTKKKRDEFVQDKKIMFYFQNASQSKEVRAKPLTSSMRNRDLSNTPVFLRGAKELTLSSTLGDFKIKVVLDEVYAGRGQSAGHAIAKNIVIL